MHSALKLNSAIHLKHAFYRPFLFVCFYWCFKRIWILCV